MKERAYVGQISHSGAQVIKAPYSKDAPKGKAVVKTGNDLRTK